MTTPPELIVSLLAVVGFALVFHKAAVPHALRNMSSAAMRGLSAMLDAELDEKAKEVAVQQAGLSLLAETFNAGRRFAAAFGAAAALIYAADLVGIADTARTIRLMMRVDYIIGVSLAAVAIAWLWRRGSAARDDGQAGGEYGYGDKFIHLIAFSGPGVQRAAAWCDDRIFSRQIKKAPECSPIFVTSLARGGTTALLNAFHDMPAIATHEYRDMPFVTAPLLWSRLSRSEKRHVARIKRAHGDGLEIDLHSPEAFEEVLWRLCWPKHYRDRSIKIWQASDAKKSAREFLNMHFRKIAMLRHGESHDERPAHKSGRIRYLSKNNANIARLRLLPKMFSDCDVVIVLRRPAAHAASLHRQHRNFARLHEEDEFILRYMRDIGHFEFGALHRPLDFDSFNAGKRDPEIPDYWLAYWIAAFKEVVDHVEDCHLVSQDDLRARPQQTMQALADTLGLDADGMDFSSYFHSGLDRQPRDLFSADLLAEAEALYEKLAKQAVNRALVLRASGGD